MDREVTSKSAMKLGIQLYLAGLSLADTVSVLAGMGIERCRTTVHNWIQKADLQPSGGCSPNHVAVDPDTNRLLHMRLFPTRTTALTEIFLAELREKHLVDDALILVDGAPWLKAACHHHNPRFYHVIHGNRNGVERVFKELKRRTESSSTISDTLSRKPQKRGFNRTRFVGTSYSEYCPLYGQRPDTQCDGSNPPFEGF